MSKMLSLGSLCGLECGGRPCTFPYVLGNVQHVPSCMSVPNVYSHFLYLPEEVFLVSVMHALSAGGLT